MIRAKSKRSRCAHRMAPLIYTNYWQDWQLRAAMVLRSIDALEIAEKTYVNVNIHKEENQDRLKTLDQLPDSCAASAARLRQQRAVFEKYNVFSPSMIDGIIRKLESYDDASLHAKDLKIIRKRC